MDLRAVHEAGGWASPPPSWAARDLLRLELVLVFPEEEGMMQQSSISISLSF